jgi:signal transduction histidine kinase
MTALNRPTSRRLKSIPAILLGNLIMFVVYVGAGAFGLMYATLNFGLVSSVWPPSGLAAGAVFVFGPRLLPGIIFGSLALNIRLVGLTPTPLGGLVIAIVIACGAGLQAWLSSALLQRFVPSREVFGSTRGVIAFVFYAAAVASVVNASFGTLSLLMAGIASLDDFLGTWLTWWIGDTTGVLVFAPFVIIWFTMPVRLKAGTLLQALVLLCLLGLIGLLALNNDYPVSFILIAALGFVAFRYGQHATSVAVILIVLVAVIVTSQGRGLFAIGDLNASLLTLEAFYVTATVPLYLLMAALYERRTYQNQLAEANQRLEEKVQERTKALTEALENADRASRDKSLFIAQVAHEFRTPLAAIAGYSDLLLEGIYGEMQPPQLETTQRIRDAAMRMHSMISDTIELGRTESDDVTLNPTTLVLRTFVNDIVGEVGSLAQMKGLTLNGRLLPGAPEIVVTDAGRVRQVAVNLVGNAIKFTQEGSVSLEVGPVDHNRWFLRVVDTGVGIALEEQSGIFDSFSRVTITDEQGRPIEGSGLGLAISKRLVQQVGGTIGLESAPGLGSTFTVTLPKVLSAPTRAADTGQSS